MGCDASSFLSDDAVRNDLEKRLIPFFHPFVDPKNTADCFKACKFSLITTAIKST
jgi:hypothetical protein